MGDSIPYDELDVDIRRLVSLLNRWPDVRTLYCCAGHENPDPGSALFEAYVLFTAATQATVRALIDALPNFGERFRYDGSQALIRNVWMSVVRLDNANVDPGALVYRLNVAGSPLFYQRAQLKAIEDALSAALTW